MRKRVQKKKKGKIRPRSPRKEGWKTKRRKNDEGREERRQRQG